ncbi:unnamed protein product [Paramecium primaurelia]|uniref:Uncharacterized protein n=1 Tax=Paramecium primaurelia TaxID=5886 RepID=A0A8S1NSZ7_PARPR|nr:unnamed protein product [Paramecium primaurelia]
MIINKIDKFLKNELQQQCFRILEQLKKYISTETYLIQLRVAETLQIRQNGLIIVQNYLDDYSLFQQRKKLLNCCYPTDTN